MSKYTIVETPVNNGEGFIEVEYFGNGNEYLLTAGSLFGARESVTVNRQDLIDFANEVLKTLNH